MTTEFTVWSWLAAGPACYHEPALPQVPGPPKLTTYKAFGPYSTQKTSLIGGDFFRLICCAPPPSLHDVGLNPNNLPLSHTSGCPRHAVMLEIFIGFSFFDHGLPIPIVGTDGDHRVHGLGAGLQPARLVTTSLHSHMSQVHWS